MIIGNLNPELVGLPDAYFLERNVFIDARGYLEISRDSRWGFNVCVYTRSHNIMPDRFDQILERPVIVKAGAWICSNAVLLGCTIGENAIVALGAVVNGINVLPFTAVRGNPAEVVATFNHERKVWEGIKNGHIATG